MKKEPSVDNKRGKNFNNMPFKSTYLMHNSTTEEVGIIQTEFFVYNKTNMLPFYLGNCHHYHPKDPASKFTNI